MAKWLIMNCVKLDMFGMQNSAVFCFFFSFCIPTCGAHCRSLQWSFFYYKSGTILELSVASFILLPVLPLFLIALRQTGSLLWQLWWAPWQRHVLWLTWLEESNKSILLAMTRGNDSYEIPKAQLQMDKLPLYAPKAKWRWHAGPPFLTQKQFHVSLCNANCLFMWSTW